MSISTAIKALGAATATYVAYNVLLAANQRRLVFNPANEPAVCPVLDNHHACPVEYEFSPGKYIRGQYYVPKDKEKFEVLVYFPGRSEDNSWLCQAANWIPPDMGLLSVNYRGSGQSDGAPGETEVVQDGCHLINLLIRDKRVEKIHLVGRSLGTGIAIQVQSLTQRASSLILITPYDSITEIAKKRFPLAPVKWLLSYRFDSIKHCKDVFTKTLVILAEHDDIVPMESTANLMLNWPTPFSSLMVKGSDHLNIPHLRVVWESIAGFVREPRQ